MRCSAPLKRRCGMCTAHCGSRAQSWQRGRPRAGLRESGAGSGKGRRGLVSCTSCRRCSTRHSRAQSSWIATCTCWTVRQKARLHVAHARCTHTARTPLHVHAGALIDRLLTQTLRLADLAMPIDPWRGRLWAAAPLPPLCSALTAYRSNAPGMRELIVEAAGRLINGSDRHLHPDVNPSDQTALWFAYVFTAPRSRLRVLALPEEPLHVKSSRPEASAHSPCSTLLPAPGQTQGGLWPRPASAS